MVLASALACACTPDSVHDASRLGCTSPTSSGDGSSSSGDPAPDLPPDCDPTVGGRVLVVGLDDATGQGPTVVYMHGTYESPEGVLAGDSAEARRQARGVAPHGNPR